MAGAGSGGPGARRRKSAWRGARAHGSAETGKETPRLFPLGSNRMHVRIRSLPRSRPTNGGRFVMSQFVSQFTAGAIVGEPEVVEDARSVRELATHPAWLRLKD